MKTLILSLAAVIIMSSSVLGKIMWSDLPIDISLPPINKCLGGSIFIIPYLFFIPEISFNLL